MAESGRDGHNRFRDSNRCLLAVLLCAAALVGCSATADDRTPRTTATQTSQSVAAPDPAERGLVTAAEPFTGEGLSGQKILYRSTFRHRRAWHRGVGHCVRAARSGARGRVAGGHRRPPTTGLLDDCAPSRHGNLLGSAGLVRDLLARGYVVAVTDYEGPRHRRPHPYLETITAGYNLIDAVRAARTLVPDASTRWAAIGVSQGGQAAWAAAERAGRYGDGLEFVGAASLSPPADLSPIVSDGPPNLDVPQQIFLPMLLDGLAVSHPDLDASAYIRVRSPTTVT